MRRSSAVFRPARSDDNGWARWISGPAGDGKASDFYAYGSNFFGYIVYADPKYDITRFDFDNDLKMTDAKYAAIFNSYDPDLSAFKAHGGKLIQYHGWVDPAIPALDSVDYTTACNQAGFPPEISTAVPGTGHAPLRRRTRRQCAGDLVGHHPMGGNKQGAGHADRQQIPRQRSHAAGGARASDLRLSRARHLER